MKTVEEIVAQHLPGPVDNDTGHDIDHRWTSVVHMKIVAAICKEYGVNFTHEEIAPCAIVNVADIKRLLVKKGVAV